MPGPLHNDQILAAWAAQQAREAMRAQWYVDEYSPGRWWIRYDAPDGSTQTIAQDVATRELAALIVASVNCHTDLLAACERALDCLTMDEEDDLTQCLRAAINKARGDA